MAWEEEGAKKHGCFLISSWTGTKGPQVSGSPKIFSAATNKAAFKQRRSPRNLL